MSVKELIKRYTLFLCAVSIGGFSIALVAFANLGVTPISSPVFVVSEHSFLTLGQATFIFNGILIILQFFIVRPLTKRVITEILLQIPVLLLFSFAIDLALIILNYFIEAQRSYIYSFSLLIIGTILLAFSITLQIIANVAMVSGEAFVKALADFFNVNFGNVKIIFDVSLVISAIALSLIATNFQSIDGVREGTVIGALSIGFLVKLFYKRLNFIEKFLQ